MSEMPGLDKQMQQKPALCPVRPGLCHPDPQGLEYKCLYQLPSRQLVSHRRLVCLCLHYAYRSLLLSQRPKLLSHHAVGVRFHFIVSHCGLEVDKVTLNSSEPLFAIGKGVTTGAPNTAIECTSTSFEVYSALSYEINISVLPSTVKCRKRSLKVYQ